MTDSPSCLMLILKDQFTSSPKGQQISSKTMHSTWLLSSNFSLLRILFFGYTSVPFFGTLLLIYITLITTVFIGPTKVIIGTYFCRVTSHWSTYDLLVTVFWYPRSCCWFVGESRKEKVNLKPLASFSHRRAYVQEVRIDSKSAFPAPTSIGHDQSPSHSHPATMILLEECLGQPLSHRLAFGGGDGLVPAHGAHYGREGDVEQNGAGEGPRHQREGGQKEDAWSVRGTIT